MFHSELYTQADADAVRDGGTVEFKLRVENKPRNEVAQDAERIAQEMAPGGQVGKLQQQEIFQLWQKHLRKQLKQEEVLTLQDLEESLKKVPAHHHH